MTAKKKAVDFSEGDSLMVDFANVEDVSFEVMPRGMYPCQVVDCEFTHSQSKGTPMWTFTLEVTDGDFAGRKLFTHMVFEGAGLPITKKQLGRIKPALLESAFDPTDVEVTSDMLGLEVKAKVSIRKWDGEDRNNVQDLFPGDDGDGFM